MKITILVACLWFYYSAMVWLLLGGDDQHGEALDMPE
jgi:hypothetical protein